MASPSHKTTWRHWQIDIAGTLLCVVLTMAAYFAALRPLMGRHAIFGQQQSLLKANQREASKLVASDFAHKKQLEVVREALADGRLTLKPAGYVNRQVASLIELVNQCGLKADDIQLGETYAGSRYYMIPISLAGSGRYGKCVEFLHKLSQVFPDTGVGSFRISGNPRKPAEEGNFRFGLFWYSAGRATLASK